MPRGVKFFLGVGLLATAALVISGCSGGGCPMCKLIMGSHGLAPATAQQSAAAEPSTPGAPHAQTVCPILGGQINKQLYVDYAGKRIYVCCSKCLPDVRKDPAKYVQQLEAKGVVLDRVPATN